MKYLLYTFIYIGSFFLLPLTAKGQFDDKFYSPSKDYKLDADLKHQDIFFRIDEEEIHVLHLLPEEKAKASVLFFLGGGGNASTYTDMIRPLLGDAYQVFIFEPRGYGKSSGSPTHKDNLADAQQVLDELIQKREVKDQPLLIYGASLGSQVATTLAARNPEKIQGLILDGPMRSFTDIALAHAPEEQKAIIRQYLSSPYSAIKSIEQIEKLPKLIIASRADQAVPFEQSEQIYLLARDPKTFWEYEGEHLQASQHDPETFLQKVADLLADDSANGLQIDISIQKLRNSKGQVVVELKSPEEELVQRISTKIENRSAKLQFLNIEKGTYTFSWFHDENENGEFDRNFIGVPKEGYGFSNNAVGKFGPPPLLKRLFKVEVSTYMELYPTYF